ncbi:hypothetical protein ABZP36_025492 [Zizania latifolia]
MLRNESQMLGKVLWVSVLDDRPVVSPAMLVDALVRCCHVSHQVVWVEVCRPADVLVSFANTQDCARAMEFDGHIKCAGARISFRCWSCIDLAESCELPFLIKLGIDGLSMHAWDEGAVRQILNSLDCQLVELLPAASACGLVMLAWSANPSVPTHRHDYPCYPGCVDGMGPGSDYSGGHLFGSYNSGMAGGLRRHGVGGHDGQAESVVQVHGSSSVKGAHTIAEAASEEAGSV